MEARSLTSPTELRSVFGRNLRELCANAASISALCTEIGINRTQFNRYLSGEAFPRPDILHRICSHFDVDARILLEPLDQLQKAPESPIFDELRDKILMARSRKIDPEQLPNAMYRIWRGSFGAPGKLVTNLALITTKGEVTRFKGYEDYLTPALGGQNDDQLRRTSYTGVALQHFDGISIYCGGDISRAVSISFLEFGLEGRETYCSGFSLLTRRRIDGLNRLTGLVLERLPNDFGLWLRIRREEAFRDIENAPPIVQRALLRIPNGI